MGETPSRAAPPEQAVQVLLLEDAPATTMVVSAYLQAVCPGIELEMVATLGAALERLAARSFDLVLADLFLPDSGGLHTLDRLLAATDKLVVVLTSDDDVGLHEGAIARGAYDFLHKRDLCRPAIGRILRLASMQSRTFRSLQEMNATLERRVAERTAELEAVNRRLESFTYSVSHDLRAPVRAVAGLSGRLRQDYGATMPADAAGLLLRIESSAKGMGEMIGGLLEFSRLGQTPLASDSIDMRELATGVLSDLLASTDCGPRVAIGPLPPACGDRTLLRLVWQNLIGNALKFSRRAAEPCVEIGGLAGVAHVEYLVKDNGAGFDMRNAERLFGVFQRLHAHSDFEGHGVGLAIARRIVERHGGAMRAEGEPGRGATFRFSLPAAR